MLSPGGKIEYSCRECKSTNIYKGFHQLMEMNVAMCRDCNSWTQWHSRIKTSLKTKKNKARLVQC